MPEPGIGYVATHGSVWDYDRRVPILFWRRGIASFEQPNAVMTVDILPTLAAQIDLPVDGAKIDGRCLDLLSGPEDSCGSFGGKEVRDIGNRHTELVSGSMTCPRLTRRADRET